jgi:hypothetical protein
MQFTGVARGGTVEWRGWANSRAKLKGPRTDPEEMRERCACAIFSVWVRACLHCACVHVLCGCVWTVGVCMHASSISHR